ncbi:unnamed protein product, partial [Cladocopium goreaui]
VWLTHLFRLVDIHTLQPLSDIPTVREWHPLEEFAAFLWETESETDPSLSMKDRFLSTLRRLADSSSEGFQGCVQLFLGPSKRVVGVKHESFGFIEAKAFASCRRNRSGEALQGPLADWGLFLLLVVGCRGGCGAEFSNCMSFVWLLGFDPRMLSLRARDTQLQDAAKVNTLHDRHVTDPLALCLPEAPIQEVDRAVQALATMAEAEATRSRMDTLIELESAKLDGAVVIAWGVSVSIGRMLRMEKEKEIEANRSQLAAITGAGSLLSSALGPADEFEGSGTPGKSVSDWFNAAVSLLFGLFIWFSEVGRAGCLCWYFIASNAANTLRYLGLLVAQHVKVMDRILNNTLHWAHAKNLRCSLTLYIFIAECLHVQPAVQLLFLSQLARQLAEQLDCERGCCQPPVFEASDLLPVASTEEESEKDKNRRLSFGTTTTGVPEEDDVLSEFDVGEDINNVDDHPDGDGGVAQAAKPQISGESSDSDGESEVKEAESRFEENSSNSNEVDGSNGASCTGAHQSDCTWACEVATTLQTSEGSDAVNGVVQIGAADACAPQSESLEANFLPEICLHVLGFLPVQEVMKQKVRAVSSNFGCHK